MSVRYNTDYTPPVPVLSIRLAAPGETPQKLILLLDGQHSETELFEQRPQWR